MSHAWPGCSRSYRAPYLFEAVRIADGDRVFWLPGGLITAVGLLVVYPVVPVPGGPILAVGLIELLFAIIVTMRSTGAE